MYFRRFIEDDLLQWKNTPEHKLAFVKGARQVGKTTTIEKFIDENYTNVIKMNALVDDDFERLIKETPYDLQTAILKYCKNTGRVFTDDGNTVLFIDEIQESKLLYEFIRQFNRTLNCDVIVTGSYLKVATQYFHYAGDTDEFVMYPVSFEEFLNILGMYEYFEETSFNEMTADRLKWIRNAWEIYCQIGGYPAVVQSFVKEQDTTKALEDILNTIMAEIKVRVNSLSDYNSVKNVLQSLITLSVREKKGDNHLIKSVSQITEKWGSMRLSTKECYSAIDWLREAGLVSYCDKVDLSTGERYPGERIFFCDLGMLTYLCNVFQVNNSDYYGLVAETYVYKVLTERDFKKDFYFEGPAFGVSANYEIDFCISSRFDQKLYGIEVKYGNNAGTSAKYLLDKRKIDYAIYFKDAGYGEMDNTVTVPLCLAWKYKFNKGTKATTHFSTLKSFDELVKDIADL